MTYKNKFNPRVINKLKKEFNDTKYGNKSPIQRLKLLLSKSRYIKNWYNSMGYDITMDEINDLLKKIE